MEPSSQNSLFAPEIPSGLIIDHLVMMNLFLAAFNTIPALPMDGGRLLRTLLAMRFGYVRAAEIAGTAGQRTAFALGAVGLLYNLQLILIATFIYLGARAVKRSPIGMLIQTRDLGARGLIALATRTANRRRQVE